MSKYICVDCSHIFDHPKRFVERHGLDGSPYEIAYGCPICGGNYVPAIYCDGCGEVITGDYALISQNGNRYCDQCYMIRSVFDD